MDIFVVDISGANKVQTELLKEFQKKEFANSEKWKEHCFSYLMLDRILREFYQIENREVVFENKKPFLKTREKFFSISHCGNFVVLAFSNYDCGIDIEKIKLRDFMKISKRMGFKCNSLEDFYYEWTKFEAEYKLGNSAQRLKNISFEDYIITAVSENVQEEFEIYIQSGEEFSNANA